MDGFTKVKKKSRRKRIQDEYDDSSPLFLEKLIRKTEIVLEQFDDEPQLHASLSSLNKAFTLLEGEAKIDQIICYGLGSLSNSKTSIYQLSLILKIGAHLDAKVSLYDPVFSLADVSLLESFKCSLLGDDRGLRRVNEPTLFFLPHAPRFVLDNILSSNWGLNLSNCIVFSDNVQSIFDNTPSRVLRDSHPFLYECHSFVDTFEVENNFKFGDVFNDFAIHVFAPSRLAEIDPRTWNREEIVSKSDL